MDASSLLLTAATDLAALVGPDDPRVQTREPRFSIRSTYENERAVIVATDRQLGEDESWLIGMSEAKARREAERWCVEQEHKGLILQQCRNAGYLLVDGLSSVRAFAVGLLGGTAKAERLVDRAIAEGQGKAVAA